jgi:hypothetical protein
MGNRPDCIHCRFMLHQGNGEYRCRQHNILLHSPVSIFCKQISLIEGKMKLSKPGLRSRLTPSA